MGKPGLSEVNTVRILGPGKSTEEYQIPLSKSNQIKRYGRTSPIVVRLRGRGISKIPEEVSSDTIFSGYPDSTRCHKGRAAEIEVALEKLEQNNNSNAFSPLGSLKYKLNT